MAVLKRAQELRPSGGAVVLDLGDLEAEADRIRAAARAEAEGILDAARREAAELVAGADARGHEEGRVRGLAEGRAEGEEEGRRRAEAEHAERLEALASDWRVALDELVAERDRMRSDLRTDAIGFAIAVARRVVLRVPRLDPTVVVDQLAAAIDRLLAPSALRVVIHPDDRAIVESALPALLAHLVGGAEARLEEDDSIERGGLRVRSGHGSIDATLARQLDRIAEALLPEGSALLEPAPAPPVAEGDRPAPEAGTIEPGEDDLTDALDAPEAIDGEAPGADEPPADGGEEPTA